MPTVFQEATVELLDYQQFLDYAAESLNYSGQTEMLYHISQKLRSNPYNINSSLTTREQWVQQIIDELMLNGYEVQYNGNNQWTGSVFPSTAQVTATNPVNSNITTVSRGKIRNWYGGLNEFDSAGLQTWVPQRLPVSGGLGSKAMYFLGSIGSGVAAASTGIWLGKTIDSALYNAIPDFWDSIGWNSLNPETWASITNGSDSPFAGMFNFMLGIDGENGNAQAYMSEDMLAYLAYGLYSAGILTDSYVYDDSTVVSGYSLNITPNVYGSAGYSALDSNNNPFSLMIYGEGESSVIAYYELTTARTFTLWLVSLSPFNYHKVENGIETVRYINTGNIYNGLQVYRTNYLGYYSNYASGSVNMLGVANINYSNYPSYINPNVSGVGNAQTLFQYLVAYGTTAVENIEGIGNQEGATLPDTTGWDDLDNVLPSLQQQYPDAFNNPMVWNTDTPYDDTAGNQTRYIPVPFPFANSATDTQPLSGTQTQLNTSLNTTPQDVLDLLTKTVQQTDTSPASSPTNPVDTGTGNTPISSVPIGTASALWTVYHPTQAQVNSFGAWLWGSPFLTNIGKLFQNPIEGVISLHKVFVPPVDSGSGSIVVGTLDSGVSSATVNEQYVEVDCGSVTLNEDFGNVFDYDPYTKIALYLPFVGIVPLNTSDVMRSTINVKYGVDIFTGACIAMVEVSRDGNNATLYQYSGNCAVHYPLSNVQQSQLLSGLITVAAGVGAIVATGGAAAPAAATGIASGAMSALHSNIGRSGGFSANAGAMGIKIPYLIIERPQTKVAEMFPELAGYPTNYSCKLGDCSGHVVVKHAHIEGINATDTELEQIDSLLKDGVIV